MTSLLKLHSLTLPQILVLHRIPCPLCPDMHPTLNLPHLIFPHKTIPLCSASAADTRDTVHPTALPPKPAILSSPSSLSGKTAISNLQMGNKSISCSTYMPAQSNRLANAAPIPALCAATCAMACPDACVTELEHILYIHSTPYNSHALQQALSLCNLSNRFPNLVHDITYCSPIGNLPQL